VLEALERTLPGAANRILTLSEDQARHRRSVEIRLVTAKIRSYSRGQWLGFFVIIGGMALGAWLSYTGHELLGLGSLLAPLTASAALFVYSRRREERERADKRSRLARP
jgi:uncharacterized membrane protein YoaK (UPF0700 family)